MSTTDEQREADLGKAYDARLMRRLWVYIRPWRGWFWAAMLCLPLTSLCSLAQPYLLKVAIDTYIAQGDRAGLLRVGGLYGLAMMVEFGFLYLQYTLMMLVAQRSLAALRLDLVAHLQQLPARFFDRNPVGRLVTRLTTDVDVINEMFAAGALTILMDVATLFGIVGIMLVIDWRLALVTLAVAPVVGVAVNYFRIKARHTYREIRDRLARLNAYLQESLAGMTVVQLFARERQSQARFDALNGDFRNANHAANIYEAALFSIIEAVSSITMAVIIWFGGYEILAGALAFGTLVAFIEYMQRFFVPIRDFSTKYAVMQSAMSSAERIFELLDQPVPIASPAAPRRPEAVRGGIEFEHVWFAYQGEDWVLRDVSFRIAPGEKVALVGHTGSGKTTIIKLLNRTYDVARGRVLIDGVDVREWDLAALRRHIGVVLQDVFLFSGSVASNLTLDRAGVERDAAVAAAVTVHADPFIRRLPRAYDEPVRERGNNLSVGQRQLLSFARALAYQPTILVLDEATSSVDTETEMLIQDALRHLLAGRTALVVAHRLSTIEHADRIMVLHAGELRESGTHAELLARRGLYYRLYQLQYAARAGAAASAPRPAAAS
ncbi:MAG: ABC transporter ATP-binding protein [Deltaproteobacteria bacterium]|nr:ABC transporter ATP-binding protein [Deltaproteobacteria bacterium]